MTQISTHVLDIGRGVPAAGIAVELFAAATPSTETRSAAAWMSLGAGETDGDGRVAGLAGPDGASPGLHRLVFTIGDYQRRQGADPVFIEETSFSFDVRAQERLHIPMLLSAYGLSIYRGS